MIKFTITFHVILIFGIGYCYAVFLQERAKVKACNLKYIKNCVVFTGRKSRNEPYLTNITATLLMPYGNNVSFALTLQMKSGGDFRIVAKVCDTLKHKWMQEFMSHYTNLTLTHCPFPAGTYKYINMELPPKNIPIPIADGDYFIRMELFITATKEPVLDIVTVLRFDQYKKPKKG